MDKLVSVTVQNQFDMSGDPETSIKCAINVTESYSLDVSTSELEAARQYIRYKIASWLDAYSTYILTAVALVGNSVALVTICSMRPRTSTSIYIATLAVVDTLCLVCKLLTVHLVRHPAIPEEFVCGFLLCAFFIVQYAASWLIVVISVERFVAVWFPLKVSLMFTKRKAIIILSTMFTVFVPLSVWVFWFYTRWYTEYWGYICVHRQRYDPTMEIIKKIHPILYIILPFVLTVAFNSLIIVSLRRASRRRQVENGENPSRHRGNYTRLTAMLLTTALVFLLLEMLMVILTLFRHYSKAGAKSFVEDFFFVEMAQTMEDSNHAVNFFIYCSDAKFRKTVLRLFRKKPPRRILTWSYRTSPNKMLLDRKKRTEATKPLQMTELPRRW